MADAASSPGDLPAVLVVEDDADVRAAAVLLLRRHGFTPHEAETPAQALALAAERPLDAVLLDLNFRRGATGGEEGLACLADLRLAAPGAEVVVVTAHSGVAMAVAAVRAGAADFVTKPWSNRRLVETLQAAVARGRAARHGRVAAPGEAWLGASAAAAQVRARIARIGPLNAPVLAHGPAGAGKSLVSRLLHAASPRAGERLREVDLEAEGVEAGIAALGAADLGTAVLARPEALPASGRPALLAALARPGGPRVVALSVHGPAALQAQLGGELAYRLAALDIEAPPLRRR
ncbi:MAG: response regulator, partial [Caulobacteraceae bacterium]|nr:response regulator [Caulobacter sp.]